MSGATYDVAMDRMLDTVQALVEGELDRGVLYESVTGETVYPHGCALHLWRYPIDQGETLTLDGEAVPSNWCIDYRSGIVRRQSRNAPCDAVVAVYTGGYDPLPADLEHAMWSVYRQMWEDANQETGGPGDGDSIAAGDVESVTISDFGTVRYAGHAVGGSGVLAPYESVLRRYRRLSV